MSRHVIQVSVRVDIGGGGNFYTGAGMQLNELVIILSLHRSG